MQLRELSHNIEVGNKRKGVIIILTIEEIRTEKTSLSQKDYAEQIGLPLRTYQDRLKDYPDFRISELIKASAFNDGDVKVVLDGNSYEITIKKIED